MGPSGSTKDNFTSTKTGTGWLMSVKHYTVLCLCVQWWLVSVKHYTVLCLCVQWWLMSVKHYTVLCLCVQWWLVSVKHYTVLCHVPLLKFVTSLLASAAPSRSLAASCLMLTDNRYVINCLTVGLLGLPERFLFILFLFCYGSTSPLTRDDTDDVLVTSHGVYMAVSQQGALYTDAFVACLLETVRLLASRHPCFSGVTVLWSTQLLACVEILKLSTDSFEPRI